MGNVQCRRSGYRREGDLPLHQRAVDGAGRSGLVLRDPLDVADDIEERTADLGAGASRSGARAGHGGVDDVDTSVFPDTKRRSYVLPIKKQVRLAEGIDDGDAVTIALTLVDN
ncbi:MAG: DUF1905 domain-containing protein [Acidimicrobiales bacterium]